MTHTTHRHTHRHASHTHITHTHTHKSHSSHTHTNHTHASHIRHTHIHHTSHTHITFCRTPLDQRSDRRRDLYLTTHYKFKRKASMTSAGFEPAIPASERPKSYILECAAIEIGSGNI
jgi:hypothetical protein